MQHTDSAASKPDASSDVSQCLKRLREAVDGRLHANVPNTNADKDEALVTVTNAVD